MYPKAQIMRWKQIFLLSCLLFFQEKKSASCLTCLCISHCVLRLSRNIVDGHKIKMPILFATQDFQSFNLLKSVCYIQQTPPPTQCTAGIRLRADRLSLRGILSSSRRRHHERGLARPKPGVAVEFLSKPCNLSIRMRLKTCSVQLYVLIPCIKKTQSN